MWSHEDRDLMHWVWVWPNGDWADIQPEGQHYKVTPGRGAPPTRKTTRTQKQAWGPDLTVAEVKDVFTDSHLTVVHALHEANQAMVRAANACRRNPIAEAKALPTIEKILRGIRDASEEVNLFGHYAAHLPSYEHLASEMKE